MSHLLGDVRFGFRLLLRNRGFTLVAVITLALGIGANTAIFSVVRGILLRSLPFPDSDRLVVLCEEHPSVAGFCVASPPNVEDWSRQSRALSALGLGRDWPFILRGDGRAEGLPGGIVTPGFLDALGITPRLGRLFRPSDLDLAGSRVVVLSHGLWQDRFGGAPDIVGHALTLDDRSYTVVGVLPVGVRVPGLENTRIWAPLHFDPRDEENRDWRGFRAYGRMAEGVTPEQVRREMDVISARLARDYPATNEGWSVRVSPLRDHLVGGVRGRLLLFSGAVGFVLLIGCVNVANLLLARAGERRRELAVRAALGAGRFRLVRQLLVESLLLSLLGGALGLALAQWVVDAFVSLAPRGIPRLDEVSADAGVLAFAVAISLAACVLFGLFPSLAAARLDVLPALKEGQSPPPGRGRLGARAPLLAAEVALALMLLVGAGLLTRGFATLLRWEPGFSTDNVLTVWLLASAGRYETGTQAVRLFDRAMEEVRTLPSVVSVGATSAGPLFGGLETDEYEVESGAPLPPGERPIARWFDVDANYFSTLGVRLVRGRWFDGTDVRGAPDVALVNETLARRHWPGEDPIGRRITMYDRTMTIVGVVADVRPFHPGDPIRAEIYWPKHQWPRWATYLVVRAGADSGALVEPIRQRLEALDPSMQVSGFATMDDLVGARLVSPRFNALLLGTFAGIALVLAAVGIYGVVTYSVSRRTREFGIRVALGAGRRDILKTVLARGMLPVLTGVGIGTVGAVLLTWTLESLLFGVPPTDPLTFGVITIALSATALVACYVPARRATRVDALVALRHE